ncbi:bifunctional metallophosphatase/5'-nucleotidase [Metabacillus sp. Hm71]|uniref:bifunctional metallophosphatase/5'-nucleotidase n=1 Tax=Metabacillus sp. Hm71 TaxID=3450743 RepID=UPI003F438E1D
MKKYLYTILLTLSFFTLFGFNAFNRTIDNQQKNKNLANIDLKTSQSSQQVNQQYQASKTYNDNEQGLSKNYHGHIERRPELPLNRNKEKENPQYKQIQLLGINDLHGQLNVTRQVNGKPAGRADYLAAYLLQRAHENKNTLFVHVGDMIGASPPISLLLQDEPTIEFLNTINITIGTVGNHEFDKGITELLRLINGRKHEATGDFAGSQFPWVAANVIDKKTGKTILPPYKILKNNGMKLGFIGVVTTDTPSLVVPSGVEGITFLDEAESINKAAAELKEQGVKAIIVLAHNPGTSKDNGEQATGEIVNIAKTVDDEVDIIFGGHNHAYLNAFVDGKLLVQSYSYGTAFSDVDIEIDPQTGDIVGKRSEIVTVYQEGISPHPETKQMIEKYEEKIEPIVSRVIGTAETSITAAQNENGESALGNFIADAQREAMKADIALMNPGGIRADLDAGEVTWGQLYVVQPFKNNLIKMSLTGQQIQKILNQQWQASRTKMLQISGFTYTWDANQPAGAKIISMQLPDRSDMDPNKSYTVVANAFLAGGGDNFTGFRKGKNRKTGAVDVDALVDYIKSMKHPFVAQIEGRIQQIN